jgi:glycogen debranching enzyme
VGNYRRRAPVISDLDLTDPSGAPLDYTATVYPHAICLETSRGEFWLAFADEESLYLKLPEARLGISFLVYAEQGRTDRRGGEFKGDPAHRRTHRNVAYTTNARIRSNEIRNDVGGYLRVQLQLEAGPSAGFLLNITPRLGFNRSMPPPEQVLQAAEERWHAWFAAVPPVDAKYASQYYYAWWILRSGLLSPRFFLTREAMAPSVIHYVGVWQWDAFFHALAYRHIDHRLAENQLRVVLDHQREDGMIPDSVHDEGVVTSIALPLEGREGEVTKPPLLAWTALKLYQASGHRDLLEEIYEPVVRWHRWWFEKNDDDQDGIVQYNHPYSSGLDDSPLWDEGMPVESPDLNTYLVLQSEALAEIARLLEMEEEAATWRARAEELVRKMIAHFWDEEAGVFWAMRNHKPIQVLTPFNLYPLLTGRLEQPMADRLVARLTSPEAFGAPFPIPTVARGDPKYNPERMWRGPTWVNINYLFIEGLVRSGYADLARSLRDKTLELMMRHDDIYEYYNPETSDPPPSAASVFGWSSAVFVDLAIKASRGEII